MFNTLATWAGLLLAQEGGAGATDGGAGGGLSNLLFYMFILAMMFYLLMIRPQRKRDAQRREILSKLKEKDRVVTAGGIHGQIVSLDDHEVTLRVDARKDVQIKIARGSISTVRGAESESAPSEPLQPGSGS